MISLIQAFFYKCLPLYLLVGAGFLAGRMLQSDPAQIGKLLVYVISPVIIFSAVCDPANETSYYWLPVLFWGMCALMGTLIHFGAPKIVDSKKAAILSFAGGSGNTGYFGFPLTVAILGPRFLPIAILLAFGFMLYENTLGYFYAARGKFHFRDSLMKMVRLPSLYAFLLGAYFHFSRTPLPALWNEWNISFRGAYAVCGMLLIGIGVGSTKRLRVFDANFFAIAYGAKFIAWPVMTCLVVFLDRKLFHLFPESVYAVMKLQSLVPLPAISVAMAAIFDLGVEITAVTVFSSTIFALVYIPVVFSLIS